MLFIGCPQGSPCPPGVGCDLNEHSQPICGDCPDGMIGDGLTCDPGTYDYINRHVIAYNMMHCMISF